ncbi:hypothetical protein OIE66_24670 [Nonomuraea sp. NBC_01738]|uniref:hypothetical protein n=1 Tax=Nonomuraea sp. NBC_01738 TaxID=2976003 RepID=UPI002E0F9F3A|nr:hypothetical protein OIE66_24670 [Nonomuraea sp. NBC_01738]
MSRILIAFACAAVLSGCAATPQTAQTGQQPTAQPTERSAKMRQLEAVKAACMKDKGFDYHPMIMDMKQAPAGDIKRISGDYAAMKESRAKEGYGVFYLFVHPDSRHVSKIDPGGRQEKPLTETQAKAMEEAGHACERKAVKEVLNRDLGNARNAMELGQRLLDATRKRELDGDPRLASLASAFGQCMKAKGYKVAQLNPTAVEGRGRMLFASQIPGVKEVENGGQMIRIGEATELTPRQAQPYLDREIKDALDDLECGKDFYAAYLPKKETIDERVRREFGL